MDEQLACEGVGLIQRVIPRIWERMSKSEVRFNRRERRERGGREKLKRLNFSALISAFSAFSAVKIEF